MTVTASYSKSILDPFEIMKDNIIISTRAMKGGNIQVLYGVNNWLECGLDLDVCYKSIFREKMNPNVDFHHPTFQCYLGETAKIHLLSAFWPQFSFVDPYISGLIGVLTTFSPKGWPAAQYSFYGQLGAGLRVNPTRHLGLFAEYGITTKKTPYTLFGLNIRFGGPKKWQQ
ncbi:MAG: hypothetical protein IJT04_06400 [Bacteroidales bacterium]|nr:hypothetical protein [Bacteroidales bacterium]